MLPLTLSIAGLYSYQKKQTIHFQELTEAGLFGIFGAVGSGKSSILEAIGFVLYGDTERLNKTDKRSYNMLNLKSNETTIEFEFLNFEDRKFKFVAHWKRRKRFEDTTPIERLGYEWKEEAWIPLDSADATEIIGLSYENFRRTIIIPQGKFKEFLDLKGKERSDMMKEIFHLQKFDLSAKVSLLQSTCKSQLDQLRGNLSAYDLISKESYLAKANEKLGAQSILDKLKADFAIIEKELELLQKAKTAFDDLDKKKSQLAVLLQQKPLMDVLQAEIVEYEKTERVFGKELLTLKQATTTLKESDTQYHKTKEAFEIADAIVKKSEESLGLLQKQMEASEQNKIKIADLDSMAKILDYKSNLASFESKIKEVHQLVETHEAQEKELNSQLSTLKTHLEELKLKRTDTSVLMAVGNWFTKQEQFQKLQMTNNTKIADKQEEGLKLKASFEALGLPSENWKAHLQAQTQTLEQKRQQLEEAKSQLVVAQELSHFADNLHDGENCPLCGATEHPNIRHTADVSELLKANAIALNESSAMLKTIQETVVQAEKRSHSISESNKQLQLLLKEKEALVTALDNHLKLFVWKEFQANDVTSFEKKSKEQKQLEVAIKLAEEQIQALDASLQTVVGNCKQFTKTKNEIEQQKASIEGALNNEVLQLKSMLVADYEGIAVAEIKRQNAVLVEEVNRIALAYKEKSEVILQQREKVATLKGSLLSEKTQWELAGNNLLKQQTLIQQLLEKEAFDNLKSVEIILSKTWDVEKEKQKTAQFAFDTQTAQKAVVDAEQLVQTQTFDAEIFSHKMIAFTELAKGIETQIGLVSSLENERLKIEQSLVLKEKLLADFAVLESRATNLSILANMFSGSGFVNYVSSIYLQNLCDVANVRFHRMTKNQLSLSINISNEFEVVDYLNNGASRSVKTLSGGQGFQASLCLALALAESVQSLNKNNKNFFFIDEGFGTQDQESVAVVFETLQSLKKENRIVGIISHVAELQEQIPRSITILKEEEKGSVVSENWK